MSSSKKRSKCWSKNKKNNSLVFVIGWKTTCSRATGASKMRTTITHNRAIMSPWGKLVTSDIERHWRVIKRVITNKMGRALWYYNNQGNQITSYLDSIKWTWTQCRYHQSQSSLLYLRNLRITDTPMCRGNLMLMWASKVQIRLRKKRRNKPRHIITIL